MAEAHGAAVGIGVVDVADVFACGAEGGCEIDLLDVHVEEVGQEDDVFERVRFDEIRSVREAVDEVRFVAVQRLVDERHVVFRGGITGDVEGVGEPFEGLVFSDLAAPFSLHGAEDGGGAEPAAEGDHAFEEIQGGDAFVEGGIGEREAVFQHACSGAYGGDAKTVGLREGFDFLDRNMIGAGEEKLDVIEAGFLGEGEAFGERLVENEGAGGGFGDLAEGDGGAH